MNLFLNFKYYKKAFSVLVGTCLLLFANISFSQKVEDLTDAQVKEFIKRAEASGMSESDIEKYALSRGYSQVDILKLKERINQVKSPSPKTNSKAEAKDDSRTINSEGAGDTNGKGEDKKVEVDAEVISKKGEYIYGSHLFNGKNLTFEPNLRLATPKNYVLGADDELNIDIFGNSQMNYKVKISPEGTVKIENLAPIVVNGLTIEQASDRIINRLKTIYYGLNSQGGGVYAQITLGSIRSIKVTVIGEVTKPGTYTVPSLATVFNVLYQAGGPSRNGSYRNISVIRDNRIIRNMDLYDFLLRADQKDNILMRDQDVIRIADYEKRVQLKGEVKRPAIFEVNKGENLKTALAFAGNFTEKAFKKTIKLIRVTDKELKIFTVNSENFADFTLEAGDIFEIDSVSNTFENRVKIKGAIYRPGDFAIDNKNLKTVKGLIETAGGITKDAFTNRATIYREGQNKEPEIIAFDLGKLLAGEINDIELQKEDVVNINTVNALHEKYTVNIYGQVNRPGLFDYKTKMTVADLILEAGGFTEGASSTKIELSRRILKDSLGASKLQNVKVYEFAVNENLAITSNEFQYILQPFDVISVKTSPNYDVQQSVYVLGEVMYPAQYTVKDREERLADILKRAGGLRESAFTKGSRIFRNNQIVSIDFENAIKNESSLDNILLLKGDSIMVPRKSETVEIVGGVFNPAIVTFQEGAKVKDYVSMAGGFDEMAIPKKVFVTYANGASAKTKSFLFVKSYPKLQPGATVVVPTLDKDSVQKLSAVEKASITTAFVSMAGILFTIIKSIFPAAN